MKLPGFFWGFEKEEHILRVKKSEVSGPNTFNGSHSEIQDNHKSNNDGKIWFYEFFQICYPCLNP